MDTATPASGVLTLDLSQDFAFEVPLSANVTSVVVSNISKYPGKALKLFFQQDSTGSRTVAGWPTSVKLAGNALTLTTAAGKRDSISFRVNAAGTALVEESRALNCPA